MRDTNYERWAKNQPLWRKRHIRIARRLGIDLLDVDALRVDQIRAMGTPALMRELWARLMFDTDPPNFPTRQQVEQARAVRRLFATSTVLP